VGVRDLLTVFVFLVLEGRAVSVEIRGGLKGF